MTASRDQIFAITVVTVEEQLRGWLAETAARIDASRHVGSYKRLADLVRFFRAWRIVDFDGQAAERFAILRKTGLRAGTMDAGDIPRRLTPNEFTPVLETAGAGFLSVPPRRK